MVTIIVVSSCCNTHLHRTTQRHTHFSHNVIVSGIIKDMHNSRSSETLGSHLELCFNVSRDSKLSQEERLNLALSMLETTQQLPATNLRDYLSRDLVEILLCLFCVWRHKGLELCVTGTTWLIRETERQRSSRHKSKSWPLQNAWCCPIFRIRATTNL